MPMIQSTHAAPASGSAGPGRRLVALRHEIAMLMDQGAGGAVLVQQMCRGVDALLTGLWDQLAGDATDRVDVAAVGGYGRGELCPHSDWDLWFIVPMRCGT